MVKGCHSFSTTTLPSQSGHGEQVTMYGKGLLLLQCLVKVDMESK